MLPAHTEAAIRALLGAAPAFQALPIESIAPLGGGVTNSNYRVRAGGLDMVLRINGENTDLLGIDRASERAAASAAAAIGAAPRVIAVIEPQGHLVTEFLPGRHLSMDEMRAPAALHQVAALLRQVHSLAPIAGEFSPFRMIERYLDLARQHRQETPASLDAMLARLAEIEATITQGVPGVPAALCHNDLGRKNFIANGALRLIDWEYAGMGDPLFDLANFAMAHQLSAEQEALLLAAYGADPALRDGSFERQKFVAALREASWALAQAAISSVDFPYQRYAGGIFGWLSRQL